MRKATIILMSALIIINARPLPANEQQPTSHVNTFHPQDILGTWYVIAYIPNLIERGHALSRVHYSLQSQDKLTIDYFYRLHFPEPDRHDHTQAKFLAGTNDREWRLWFYRLIPIHQRVEEVDPNGRWILMTSPGHDLAWILSRQPIMDQTLYRQLVNKLREQYDVYTDKLYKVPQVPTQVGQLGFDVLEAP